MYIDSPSGNLGLKIIMFGILLIIEHKVDFWHGTCCHSKVYFTWATYMAN